MKKLIVFLLGMLPWMAVLWLFSLLLPLLSVDRFKQGCQD